MMFKFFHHLFNPHCPDCIVEELRKKECNSCDTLRMEIGRLQDQNDKLLSELITPKQEIIKEVDTSELIPIQPRRVPQSVLREQYEREDRRLAEKLRKEAPKPDKIDKEKELEVLNQLEKELG